MISTMSSRYFGMPLAKKLTLGDAKACSDRVRRLALPLNLVEKVCSVYAAWSGLKLVIRKALR